MTRITLQNLHVHSRKVVNSFFRHGLIVGEPITGRVVGIYAQGRMDAPLLAPQGALVELPSDVNYPTKFDWFFLTPETRLYRQLRLAYPNCRIRMLRYGEPGRNLPKQRALQIVNFLRQTIPVTPQGAAKL